MKEMKQEVNKEKEAEKKAQTIKSEPAFCIKFRVAKVFSEKDKKKKKDAASAAADVKLFDFHESQIKESFTENDQKGEPLEEPILYLNIVFHEKVLSPLNK